MKRAAVAAMMITVLATPALAQDKGPPTARTESEKKQDAELDKAYRDALKRNGPVKPAKSDPWQDMRPAASSDNTAKK